MNGESSSNESSVPEVDFLNTATRDPLVDTTLDGRFVIEEVLGSGGMSVIYRARQLTVNRHVAIKTLRMQMDARPIYKERFEREISSLCTLNHPNIVTVYDCIIGPDDQPYVVMDYLRGRSLEALIKSEGPIVVGRFASIAMQICSALDHAHKKGVVHRDLKPANIVLMDDETDFVKVVDFGLAKLSVDNRNLTQSGELWGSPPYMSPEQCMGESGDHRSDIYSIGAVMYEMIVGKDPFNDARTVFDFVQRHIHASPPPFFQANPNISVSFKLEGVIFKALEKSPLDRYQSALELQDAIVEACSEESGNLIYHPSRAGRTTGGTGIEIGPLPHDYAQKQNADNSKQSEKTQQGAWFAGMLDAGVLSESVAFTPSDQEKTVRDATPAVASSNDVLLKASDSVPLSLSEVQSLTAQEKAAAPYQQTEEAQAAVNFVFQQTNNSYQISDNIFSQDNLVQHNLSDNTVDSVKSGLEVEPGRSSADGKYVSSNMNLWAVLTLVVVLLVSIACMTTCMPKKTEPSGVSKTVEQSPVSLGRKHRRPKLPAPTVEEPISPDEPTNQSTGIELE